MRKLITILFLVHFSNVNASVDNRKVPYFNSLMINSTLEVVLIQGESNKVKITGVNPSDLTKVKTVVQDGQLQLSLTNSVKSSLGVRIYLTFKDLRNIEQRGTTEIMTATPIETDTFMIQGEGTLKADMEFKVDYLATKLSGVSNVKLTGETNYFDINLSGSSNIRASDLIAENVKMNISGASDAHLYASHSITGQALGASNIRIRGNPIIREIQSPKLTNTFYSDSLTDVESGNTEKKEKYEIWAFDTTEINLGVLKIIIPKDSSSRVEIRKKDKAHWSGVDLGINGFLNSSGNLNLTNSSQLRETKPEEVTQFMELDYRKSWSFSINFIEYYLRLKRHHIGIVTGLGSEWSNYELKHNVRLNPEGGSYLNGPFNEFSKDYTWGEVDTVLQYSKNRLKTWFINAPILMELNLGRQKNKSFHLAIGGILGFNLQTKVKYKFNTNGENKKVKDKDDFNTNPFRFSLTSRMGYGWFNVFATYSLTPFFEKGRGPKLYPFVVGVTLLGF